MTTARHALLLLASLLNTQLAFAAPAKVPESDVEVVIPASKPTVHLNGDPLPEPRVKPGVAPDISPEMTPKPAPLETLPVLHPFGVGATLGLGLPAPFKYGLTLDYRQNAKLEWELGILAGSVGFGIQAINIGGFNETLYSATARYSPWMGSFNWIGGIALNSYDVHLGNAILSRLSGGAANWDLLKVRTLALQLGVGNRWRFGGRYFIGVDWLVITYPIKTIESESPALDAYQSDADRRDVEHALDFMQSLPSANILKTTLGMSF